MATLLQCDQCQRTERPALAYNWVRVEWEGPHIEFTGRCAPVPALLCGLGCLRLWTERMLERRHSPLPGAD